MDDCYHMPHTNVTESRPGSLLMSLWHPYYQVFSQNFECKIIDRYHDFHSRLIISNTKCFFKKLILQQFSFQIYFYVPPLYIKDFNVYSIIRYAVSLQRDSDAFQPEFVFNLEFRLYHTITGLNIIVTILKAPTNREKIVQYLIANCYEILPIC